MTVEVETPQGLRTGSSVIEVTKREGPAFPGPEAGRLNTDIRGEAVAVDLPGGQTLFALLGTPDRPQAAADFAPSAFAAKQPDLRQFEWREQIRALKRMKGAAELPPAAYPMLVRFRSISDPRTVEQVNPQGLAAAFGMDMRLRKITVEVTDERITKGIANRFPWWRQYLNRHFDNTPTSVEDLRSQRLDSRLSSGSFSTERE